MLVLSGSFLTDCFVIDHRGDFNAILKVGVKETILNKPDKPPFPLARFKAGGFTRLPSVLGLRLVKGRAADLRTRSLALRYHVAGEQGVELWSETVNATELTLAACKVSVVKFFYQSDWAVFVSCLDSRWAHFRGDFVAFWLSFFRACVGRSCC